MLIKSRIPSPFRKRHTPSMLKGPLFSRQRDWGSLEHLLLPGAPPRRARQRSWAGHLAVHPQWRPVADSALVLEERVRRGASAIAPPYPWFQWPWAGPIVSATGIPQSRRGPDMPPPPSPLLPWFHS
ncbi:hypothetical protein TCAP_03499 [Tolypocladium capitatum]|uniref:Uncharacterized protein n=1 Tax=Tolypocladium capitatum TaxID=45235 RepID=A0A2K3QG89_9HYPO|nr:hypothetical protein TCAP_03499 [Tolypocladium capitatum]